MAFKRIIKLISMVVMGLFLSSSGVFSEVLVKDDFEGSRPEGYSLWLQNTNCCTDTTVDFITDVVHSGSKSVRVNYVLDDSPRGDCQLHQDNNTSLIYKVSGNVTHYFFRGYFRIETAEDHFCNNPIIQRKLVYFKPQGWGSGSWAFFIVAWPWGSNCTQNGYNVSVAYGNAGGTGTTLWGDDGSAGFDTKNNHVYPNQWYYLEMEAKYASYGNDSLKVWMSASGSDPVLIFDRTGLALRSPSDVENNIGLGVVEVGRQVDVSRSDYSLGHINEFRYWDDIVISTEKVGPISSVAVPGPPQNFKINITP
ncbi:hypothetical protein SAMN02746065_10378 [Desulfocicer vacuolatum DSM 3385]|uniref:Concanavalin A-like lectin/glucanases superfamily protein n=1 Tax=Desulfocicer vacuolatum DSM 3385 TaxID=1121400 RepID=A0A1W1ZPC3_9BACT|nr:hypothetical protein [Desulfocicer vacuolatum]SMC50207.1 hypothetical protein SAMN02746065_10378 [Desulfocicer vacuolatum DSM 3385]